MEKAQLTAAQCNALGELTTNYRRNMGVETYEFHTLVPIELKNLEDKSYKDEWACLNDLTIDEMIRAFYVGWEQRKTVMERLEEVAFTKHMNNEQKVLAIKEILNEPFML